MALRQCGVREMTGAADMSRSDGGSHGQVLLRADAVRARLARPSPGQRDGQPASARSHHGPWRATVRRAWCPHGRSIGDSWQPEII